MYEAKHGPYNQTIPTPLVTREAALVKSCNISKPQDPHQSNGDGNIFLTERA